MPRPSQKHKLLEAAMATFCANGYRSCTIEDIAQSAGVVKGSFYNHFKSKEALAVEVIKLFIQEKVLPLLALEGPPTPLKRLRAHFEQISEVQKAINFEGCMVANFSAEVSNLGDELRSALTDGLDLWIRAVAEVVRQAQVEGEVGKKFKAEILARCLVNACEGALVRARVIRDPQPFDDFLAVTFKAILTPRSL
jgi:TetR/AcrR family transcriptional repressor of nem operon